MSADKIVEALTPIAAKLAELTPVAAKLALETLEAIHAGDPRRAARRAEEAARREIMKASLDRELAAKARLKKRSEAAKVARVVEPRPAAVPKKGGGKKKGKPEPESQPEEDLTAVESSSAPSQE